MPRKPRFFLPDIPVHVVQRGHSREPVFFEDSDYRAYLDWLTEAAERYQCAVHAYVLMTNHVHLLVTPEHAASIPRLIIALGRRYVQYVNHTYRRTGTLWDSRYKSSLVDAENYLLICQRYIELNPVRAAMVTDPAEYRWSSYRHHAFGQAGPNLTPHPLYIALGADEGQRQTAYRDLFTSALEDAPVNDLRMALNQNQPIGNSRFYDRIEAMTGQRRELRKRGRPRKKNDGESAGDPGQRELPLKRR